MLADNETDHQGCSGIQGEFKLIKRRKKLYNI
jgi:hypothetical protein